MNPAHERSLTRHPVFWIALALLVAGSVAFSARYFVEAFPLAGVELEMDRDGALERARSLAEQHDWGPDGFRQAASFSDPDRAVRVYVELEAGEDDSLARLREDGGYHPFRWQVRHFREGETREVSISFTPSGEPYGFRLRLPEDEPGAALSAEEARVLAEREAGAAWGVDLGRYELVESSQETRPGARVDHTFVYERRAAAIADAEFRLRLEVAGDRPSGVTHMVRVPEAFSLRYAEMRTANTRLALVASLLFMGLFLLVGCGGGAFYLLRAGWLEWRTPLVWGGIVAAVTAAGALNQLPLAWMGYDTALPATTFLLQQVGVAVLTLVAGTGLLALIFMVAESLGRRAFPNQPQQWRFWHPEVARSGPVLGRTVGGYAVAALEIGFVVAFYLWAMRREGWWMPSEALVQPDLLASYFPWLSAISMALLSGFWEESLFRAVPIAGAALIGTRLGGRRWWILGALLLQAAVFAAAHADYPQQPSYARLAELFLPALFWGVLYIWFGLVPVIIAHAGYNLTLASIPIWVSAAPGVWGDRLAIVVIGLVPLWIVLYHIWRRGYRPDLPTWARHGAWAPAGADAVTGVADLPSEPSEPALGRTPEVVDPPPSRIAPPWARRALVGCAFTGVVLLAVGLRPAPHAPTLAVDRTGAVELARVALEERGFELDEGFRPLAASHGPAGTHQFVWDEGGREAYSALLDTYVGGPGWTVRFARFTGPVEERAEEFRVDLDPRGELWRFEHRLPEDREGATLEEEDARAVAGALLQRELGRTPEELTEVSAIAGHRPNRRDWTFTWSDEANYPLERGEARLRIDLAGDELRGQFRFIDAPEEWERERQARSGRMGILNGVSQGLFLLLFAGGIVAGVVGWARGRFHLSAAAGAACAVLLATGLRMGNGLPSTALGFTTTQGYGEQLLTMTALMGFGGLVVAGALGLNAGFVHAWMRNSQGTLATSRRPTGLPPAALVGIALGLLVAGLRWGGVTLGPRDLPPWPPYGGAGTFLPFLAAVPQPVASLVSTGLFVLLVLVGFDRLTDGGTRRRALGALALVLAGIAAPGPTVAEAAWGWILVAAITAVGLFLLHRISQVMGLAFVPWLVATVLAVHPAREIVLQAYSGVTVGGVLALIVLGVLAWGWSQLLNRNGSTETVSP